MKLDRTKAPLSEAIKKLDFLAPHKRIISEHCNLYSIHQDDQEVVKLQFVFKAGTKFQNKPLLASFTNSLIIEGTSKYSSGDIAELFDNEGAFLETECQPDNASIILYCLAKSLVKLIPLLKEIIFSANFLEEEVEKKKAIQRDKFIVNSEKVSFIAKKEFLPFILGSDNSYSNNLSVKDFNEISREDIVEFHKSYYLNQPVDIFFSGKVEESLLKLIEDEWKGYALSGKSKLNYNVEIIPNTEKEFLLEKNGALQSAIRIGKPIIGKPHRDFPKLLIANTILGGYFGSRLMTNIREDKGYTYGIGSGIITYKEVAYFVISTEVGAEVTPLALKEVEKEVNKMNSTLVTDSELSLVKNYMNGSIMRSFDGAFSSMDRFMTLKTLGLNYSYYETLFKEINRVSAKEILDVSQQYLTFESMKKIIVGKAN